MLDVIRGAAPAPARDWFSYIAQGSPEAAAVQDGPWKLVVRGGNVLDASIERAGEKGQASGRAVELFRLDRDPGEQTSLVGEPPDVAARLLERLKGFRRLKTDSAPDWQKGREGFKAPKEWMIQN